MSPTTRFWFVTITSALLMLGVRTFFRWLAHSRERTFPARGGPELFHPLGTLLLGMIVLSVALLVIASDELDATMVAIAVVLGLGGLWMVAAWVLERHEVWEEGMRHRSSLGKVSYLRWSELRSVAWDAYMKWLRIESSDGTVVRISALLAGLPRFAQVVMERAPHAILDDETRTFLERAADNVLPDTYGV